jgi:hypothetical protein
MVCEEILNKKSRQSGAQQCTLVQLAVARFVQHTVRKVVARHDSDKVCKHFEK